MSYSSLQSDIDSWLENSFTTSQKQQFIAFAEAKFNRELRTLDMEIRATASVSTEYVGVPSDFLEMITLQFTDANSNISFVEYVSPSRFRQLWTNQSAGTPKFYTIVDGQFQLTPSPDATYTMELVYYGRLSALSDSNTTNWLLDAHPDLYLAQSLAAASTFGWNDERAASFAQTADNMIFNLNETEKNRRIGSAPLAVRPEVSA